MAKLTKSIRWRFVCWLVFLLACVLTAFGVTAYQLHRTNQFAHLDEELKYRVSALSAARRTPPFGGGRGGEPRGPGERGERGDRGEHEGGFRGPPPGEKFGGGRPPAPRLNDRDFQLSDELGRLFDQNATNGFYFVLWNRTGDLVIGRSTNAPATVPQPRRPGRDTGTYLRTRGTYREAYHYTERGDGILAGRSIEADIKATQRFVAWLVAGGFGVLALAISCVWLLTGRALKPVQEISATATRIAAGNLSERINVSETDDELGQLAATLNSSFARLEAVFAQQKQFTADASHELRTPIAVLISEAQTTLARKRTAEEYRATVNTCLETAQQMRRLTESLLELARFDAGQANIRHEPFDLAETARACVELIQPLADQHGIQVRCNLAPARVPGDNARFGQVITNLLTNAIHYNKSHGEICVRTCVENSTVTLTVADTGQGITPEDLPHIFERFYRADKARSRTEGRTGLGLAICKAIVEAEGGVIEVTSTPGVGSTFTVRLPADHLR